MAEVLTVVAVCCVLAVVWRLFEGIAHPALKPEIGFLGLL